MALANSNYNKHFQFSVKYHIMNQDILESQNPVFLTYFPECKNIHLTKDVGMIPFILHRSFSYNSYILTYRNDEYSYLNVETPGLKLCFINKSREKKGASNKIIDNSPDNSYPKSFFLRILFAWRFLLKNRNKITVFQLYHYKWESRLVALLYRLYNPKGILYLKLDMDPDSIETLRRKLKKMKWRIFYQYIILKLTNFDIISVETEIALNFLKKEHPLFTKVADCLHYVPNGFDSQNPVVRELLERPPAREDIIVHIGRLGAYAKGTDVALESFASIAPSFPHWKLVLIGPMEDSFRKYFADFLESHANIGPQINYKGYLPNRKDIFREYAKAKILLQPSRFESFGLVVTESGILGTILIGSNIGSFKELTNDGRYGVLCPVDDIQCFSKALQNILSHPDVFDGMSYLLKSHMQKRYNWNDICNELNDIIFSCIEKKIDGV